jgi:K+-transporting ATPase ATPase C chain
MKKNLISSAIAVLVFTVLLGVAYPLVMTGIAQVGWPKKAGGDMSMIAKDTKGNPRYFAPRPSATGYNPNATFFSNRGPNQASARFFYRDQLKAYLKLNGPYNPGLTNAKVPADAVETSGSGVDPHISEANALIQARRVAKLRGLPLGRVQALVREHVSHGAVNVNDLNRAVRR